MTNNVFIDTLKGIKRERPPVWFMRQAGRVLPSYLKLRQKYSFGELMKSPELTAEVTLLPVFDLNVDAAILFSDILVIPEALGMKLDFTDKGPVFETPLSNVDNIDILNPNINKLEHIYKAIDLIIEKKPKNIPLIGFCGGPFTTFCYMVQGSSSDHSFGQAINLIYNNKCKAIKLFEIITELSIKYALNQIKHGVNAFQLFETHAGLLPLHIYNDVVLPYVKKITAAVRNTDCPVIFFPKGIGIGISKMNIDIADLVGVDWQSDIYNVRNVIDTNVGLQGNLDPRLLSVSDKSLLIKELERLKDFGSKNYNWIFNTGHGLSPDNKFENVKFVVDWIKNQDWSR